MTDDSMSDRIDGLVDNLTAAATAQRMTRPTSHADFYAWGWGLSDMAARLSELAATLGRQVEQYATRGDLYDDEGGDHVRRLGEAAGWLEEARAGLDTAASAARQYHSAVEHIGVKS